MLEALTMFNDELMELIMEEKNVPEELIHAAVREGTLTNQLVPVYLGSAYKNKGVQPLLDAIIRYMPCPLDIENKALDLENDEKEVVLSSDPDKPTVALAFKLEDGQYGQLTYIRNLSGYCKKRQGAIQCPQQAEIQNWTAGQNACRLHGRYKRSH